jgi:UDP-N-acetylmuramate--alanine ligase
MTAPGTRIHIVGAAGAGMSGVARLLHERGCVVSGSDADMSGVASALATEGIAMGSDTDPLQGSDADVVLWSPAVSLTHPTLTAARERGATLLTRAQMLETLGDLYDVVGLTGTHGKTTATSMMVHIMVGAQRDDSWLLGAEVLGIGANGHAGSSSTLVLETDESYGTFDRLSPYALAVLNVEADHLDHYGDLATLESAFAALVSRTRGPVVVWSDDAGVQRVIAQVERSVVTVGTSSTAQWRVSDVQLARHGATFSVTGPVALALSLAVTGIHNVANAATTAVLALSLGIEAEAVTAGLAAFRGAPRRFEFRGRYGNFDVFEDYAHLPGEIAATLKAAKDAGYQRIIAVFQPHRYTRTAAVGEGFAPAFDDADEVIVTAIYTAGEENTAGVRGESVAESLHHRRQQEVPYLATKAEVLTALATRSGDALFFLGAGDVGEWAAEVVGQ